MVERSLVETEIETEIETAIENAVAVAVVVTTPIKEEPRQGILILVPIMAEETVTTIEIITIDGMFVTHIEVTVVAVVVGIMDIIKNHVMREAVHAVEAETRREMVTDIGPTLEIAAKKETPKNHAAEAEEKKTENEKRVTTIKIERENETEENIEKKTERKMAETKNEVTVEVKYDLRRNSKEDNMRMAHAKAKTDMLTFGVYEICWSKIIANQVVQMRPMFFIFKGKCY